jgi:hypothetical protein
VVVKHVSYTPQRVVHSLPANPALRLAKLKPGAHKLRAAVSYRVRTGSHHKLRTRRVTKTLALRFKVCPS